MKTKSDFEIGSFQTLGRRRRANAKRDNKSRRLRNNFRKKESGNGTTKNRNGRNRSLCDHPGVNYRADGAIPAGKLRVVRMYVDCLNEPNQGNNQYAHQNKGFGAPRLPCLRFGRKQAMILSARTSQVSYSR
jgi:hypothetical protein